VSKRLTLAGRKLDMTSLTFCVGGPAGGGGGPGVADPVTMVCGGRRCGCDRGVVFLSLGCRHPKPTAYSALRCGLLARRVANSRADACSYEMLSRGRAQIITVDPCLHHRSDLGRTVGIVLLATVGTSIFIRDRPSNVSLPHPPLPVAAILWTAPRPRSARQRAKGILSTTSPEPGISKSRHSCHERGHNVHNAGVCVAGGARGVSQKLTCAGRSLPEELQHAVR